MITKSLFLTKASQINFLGHRSELKKIINNNQNPGKHYHCAYGGEELNENHPATAEHVIPHSKLGPSSTKNYLPVCLKHNKERGNKPLWDYLKPHPEIVDNINKCLNELKGLTIKEHREEFNYTDEVTKSLIYAADGHLQKDGNDQLKLVNNPTEKEVDDSQRQYLIRTDNVADQSLSTPSDRAKALAEGYEHEDENNPFKDVDTALYATEDKNNNYIDPRASLETFNEEKKETLNAGREEEKLKKDFNSTQKRAGRSRKARKQRRKELTGQACHPLPALNPKPQRAKVKGAAHKAKFSTTG